MKPHRALASIRERVEAIHDIVKKHFATVHPQQERERKLESSEKIVRAEITFDEKSKRELETDSNRQYRVQNSVKWATWFAFGAAVIYAGIAAYQSIKMRESNEINSQSLLSVQRAFVIIGKNMQENAVMESGKMGTGKTFPKSWEFRPHLQNSGGTPTRNARNHASFLYVPVPLPEQYRFADMGDIREVPFILGPKEDATGALLSVPFDIIKKVKNKTMRLYFYGWVTYDDIFPKTPKHVSMFCTELTDIRGELTTGSQYQFAWSLCGHHNCADDECIGEPYGTYGKMWPN
jgi:hypothetical protein